VDVQGKLFAILGRERWVLDQVGIFEGKRMVKLATEIKHCADQLDGRPG